MAGKQISLVSKIRASARVVLLFTLACSMCFGSHASVVAPQLQSPQKIDEDVNPDQFSHSFWSAAQGAPQNITSLAQTSDGLLWIATQQGLYTFDGTRFERFKSSSGHELSSNSVYSVFAPRSGGLWVGYLFGGFSFVQNGEVYNFNGQTDDRGRVVYQIVESREGQLWAGTSGGLMRFTGGTWQFLGPEWNAPLGRGRRLGFDKDGRLWVVSLYNIYYLEPNSTHFQMLAGPNVDPNIRLCFWPDGTVWTHSVEPPIMPDNATVSPLFSPQLQSVGPFTFIDRKRHMWVFSPEKTLRFDNPQNDGLQPDASQLRSISTFSGINAAAILVDLEGSIWIGSIDGLHRFSYTPLRHVGLKTWELNPVVAPSGNGDVFIAVGWSGDITPLYRLAGSGLHLLRGFDDPIEVIYNAPDGSTWFGNASLWHLQNGKFSQTFGPSDVRPTNARVQTMTADRDGNLWVSFTSSGLYRLSNGMWTRHDGTSGLPSLVPLIASTASDGSIWFGFTKNRLSRLHDGKAANFGPADGLDIGNITAIQESGGEIWIGGESGLEHFDHGLFHKLNTADPENLRGITGIIRMPNGDLWLNGLSGIVHIEAQELRLSIADSMHKLTGQRFSREDGLVGYPPQTRPMPSAIQGTDGRLWFTTTKGVVWLDPSHAVKQAFKPVVNIRSITADGKQHSVGRPLILAAGTSNVRIEYDAVNLSEPESVHYRYKLQGTGADWLDASEQTYVSYLSLKPGAYTFLVEATDNNGVWSENPTSLSMRILPAFYQTWWFPLLLASIVFLSIYVVLRVRIEQNAKQVRLQYAVQLMERTRLARDLHDTFMQTVQASKMAVDQARNESDEAAHTHPALDLGQLSLWLGQATEEGRAALNSLRAASAEECDLPEALRRAIDECRMQRLANSSFVIAGDVRETYPAVRDEIYRIAYEAISNACAHSQANQLIVRLTYAHDLSLSIVDDGIGIAPLIVDKGKEGHFGLQGMRERVARIEGKLTITSSAGTGTEIAVSIPGRIVYRKAGLTPLQQLRSLLRYPKPSQDK